jgi:hypothetical protein
MTAEPKMPSSIAGLEKISLYFDDADDLEKKSANIDVSDADSFFNLPDDADDKDED